MPSGIAKLYFGYAQSDTVAQLTRGYNGDGWVGASPLSRDFPLWLPSQPHLLIN